MNRPGNIIIINLSNALTETIKEILELENFSFRLYEAGISLQEMHSVKVFCLSAPDSAGQDIWETITSINQSLPGPSLLLCDFNELGLYRASLSAGIDYFMAPPFMQKHFAEQIRFLVERSGSIHKNKTEKEKSPTDDQSPLLFSLANSIHHRSLIDTSREHCHDESDHLLDFNFEGETYTQLKKELKKALEKGEFRLFYQPVMDINTGRLAGFESLIRWESPDRGMVGPDDFIPAAEKSNVIIAMGYWIIEEAVTQLADWKKEFTIDRPFKVGINLSARQFLHQDLSRRIIDEVSRRNLPPESVAFEITESAFMEDMEKANITLLTLKSEKFPLYLDDFGTGYSSLTYLLHFPVDTIKIDKSFVEWMHIDEQSMEIVRSVTTLAHNLGMKVVAEGIESEEHLAMAADFGCDLGQGYFFSKPLPAAEATEFVREHFAENSSNKGKD